MKKIGLLFSLLLFSQGVFGGNVNTLNMLKWIEKCLLLPTNIAQPRLGQSHSVFGNNVQQAQEVFSAQLNSCIHLMSGQLQGGSWQGPQYSSGFAPFTQKLDLPEGAQVVFHGDFHGDVHSFANELADLHSRGWLNDDFKIIQPNTYMVFLGDYVDRGNHGAEVIYTLLRLKLANPDRVFMVRGNHEDLDIQREYGFKDECDLKFGNNFHHQIARIYDLMPVVLYVGCGNNYLQCCHGGMEPGYNPATLLNSTNKFQLLGELKRSQCACNEVQNSKQFYIDFTPTAPIIDGKTAIGFMWHDFEHSFESKVVLHEGRGLSFAKGATQDILNKHNQGFNKKVRGVFRAHQHSTSLNDMMRGLIASKGVYKLWNNRWWRNFYETSLFPKSRSIADGLVWTFNVAPDTAYGKNCKFTFDAFGILTVNSDYEKWGLQVVNTYLKNKSLIQKVKDLFCGYWKKIYCSKWNSNTRSFYRSSQG